MMFRQLIAVLLVVVAPNVLAAVTYSYSGPTFYNANAPYTNAQNITGSFTVANPLAPNLSNADIGASLVALSFSDGQATRTLADSVLCGFEVSTDASGNISGHSIWLRQSNTTAMQNQHNIEIYDPSKGLTDQAGFGALGGTTCAPVALDPFANSSDGTGVWAAIGGTQRSVPLNASWALALMFGLLGFTAYRRMQAQG
ncbi:hypothetical protein C7S18_02965 [Ahniella affigens]|uniref:IPTL-CTERM protein sorting domain-containing protein n=1 Tax=Ahniella affigens TaxID=2021234 RepID=A0A2P1PMZ6_9GAMM|nr:hypothetical protein [Ahniella affigens]AVP96216.1 hypothetical protein C7S18_02965 [Ahniella affigens]